MAVYGIPILRAARALFVCRFERPACRPMQGPWSRRRDARTTTKAGLRRPSRAGRAWLLHASSSHLDVVAALFQQEHSGRDRCDDCSVTDGTVRPMRGRAVAARLYEAAAERFRVEVASLCGARSAEVVTSHNPSCTRADLPHHAPDGGESGPSPEAAHAPMATAVPPIRALGASFTRVYPRLLRVRRGSATSSTSPWHWRPGPGSSHAVRVVRARSWIARACRLGPFGRVSGE